MYRIPIPTSPYGASKVCIEALGRYFAKSYNLSVICIRLEGVNSQDAVTEEILAREPMYHKIWLSHRDCVDLFRKCIETPRIPENFCVIYGVSDNASRIHDISNSVGWFPRDGFGKQDQR
ncbi:NAD(P)-dependent oxidoreductase [bacterium]|nr:NAD(P)-dependent oxidoreductase [bacterium]